jgi:hypothetical protein
MQGILARFVKLYIVKGPSLNSYTDGGLCFRRFRGAALLPDG